MYRSRDLVLYNDGLDFQPGHGVGDGVNCNDGMDHRGRTLYPSARTDGRQNANLLTLFNSGALDNDLTIILLIGSTRAGKTDLVELITGSNVQNGTQSHSSTVATSPFLTRVEGKPFLLIDTPGFGNPDLSNRHVRRDIRNVLTTCTRRFGGIHGILHVEDVRTHPDSPALIASTTFLRELCSTTYHPPVTFVTTGWDAIREEDSTWFVQVEREMLRAVRRLSFRRPFRLGVGCQNRSGEVRGWARAHVVEHVLSSYMEVEVERVGLASRGERRRESIRVGRW